MNPNVKAGLIFLALAMLLVMGVFTCRGQTPVNGVLLGAEGIVVTSTTGTAVTFAFGAPGHYNTVANPVLPLAVTCSAGCPLLGGDPAPNVLKSLYALQQQTAYTVTLKTGVVVAVPALGVVPPVVPPAVNVMTFAATINFNGTNVTATCTAPVAKSP